jgi:type IV pilus assembly protein PilM
MSKQIAFGLDIGSSTIKAVSLKHSGDKFAVDFIAVSPSLQKGMQSESLADLQNVAAEIKKMLSEAGVKSQLVNISLPESQIYTKIIEMPMAAEKDLVSALKWEMEQYIPLPPDQVRTDYQILAGGDAQNSKVNIFLVAAPIALIQKYEKVLELAGLTAQTIETEIISVLRALSPLVATPQASIIVNIGATNTNIAVVKNGILNTAFSIDLGGRAITRAIAADLGIDVNEAETYKKAYGLNKQAFEGKIGQSLNPILEAMASDIKKTMFAYKEKSGGDEVKQIVLSGGTALLPGIDVYFTNTLSTQVVVGRCWSSYNVQNVPEEIMYDAPSFNVVCGLALKDYFD